MLDISIRSQLLRREICRLIIFGVAVIVGAPKAIPALKLFYTFVHGGFNG